MVRGQGSGFHFGLTKTKSGKQKANLALHVAPQQTTIKMNATVHQSSNSTIVYNPHRGLQNTVEDDRVSVFDKFWLNNYGNSETSRNAIPQLLLSEKKNEQPSSSGGLKLVSFEPTPIGPKETIHVAAPSKVNYNSKLSLLQNRRTLLECLRPLLPATISCNSGSSINNSKLLEDDILMVDGNFTSLSHNNKSLNAIPITNSCLSTSGVRRVSSVSPSSSCDNSEKSTSSVSSVSSPAPPSMIDSLLDIALIPAEIQSHNNSNSSMSLNGINNIPTDEAFAMVRFRASQMEQWGKRYKELIVFREEHGHCVVPLYYPANPTLSHWVKRQRCQYKLKVDGKHSTLTDERQSMLEELGFTWDSHNAAWEERFFELCVFKENNGHCNVPSSYPENPPLAAWIKCQRRYIRTYFKKQLEKERALSQGRKFEDKTAMKYSLSGERVKKLIDIGLRWKKKC